MIDTHGHDQSLSRKPVVMDIRVVSGAGGGPDKTILNSPRFLDPWGYRNICAFMHTPGDPGFEVLRRRAGQLGAPLVSVPDRGPWDWTVVSRMLEICRREEVALWHGHDYKSNALGLLLRRFWAMRLVTTVHGWVTHTLRTPLYYGIDRFCLPRYEVVICVSEDLYRRSLECGVPKDRCVLIENAIDTKQLSRTLDPAEAKRRLGIPTERLLIGSVGRLSKEKGFDILIRAVDRLLARGYDLELRIAGEGDQKGPLEKLIRSLGHEDRIHLIGFQADPLPLYQAMDLYALSSIREGLPNVLLEAMALGVPVVATEVAGVPRVITHEINGLLVPIGSVDALGTALGRLLDNSLLRARLGQEGRQTIEDRFSFEVRMRKIREIYDGVLSDYWEKKGRRPAPTLREQSS